MSRNFRKLVSILEIPWVPTLDKTDNFDFLGPNLPKKVFRVGNSEN